MRGYNTAFGYMGYVPELGRYVLFASEEEYRELCSSWNKEEN